MPAAVENVGTSRREDSAVEFVVLDALLPAHSPRSQGEDEQHIRMLAEAETALPPILVHRPTMRVIDGMHRLRAAGLRGDKAIAARFFDGSEEDAFVLAVRSNTTHGLPLTIEDRRRAARRILAAHPQWSNRAVAEVAGLSAKSVAGLRAATPGDQGMAGEARTGRDGRVRPLDTTAGRELACRLLEAEPGASLRDIARRAGVSPGTVRDVRRRLSRGDDPVPAAQRRRAGARRAFVGHAPQADPEALLDGLSRDPALRYHQTGRDLLRLMSSYLALDRQAERLASAVPAYCAPTAARMAWACADAWAALADRLSAKN